MNLVPQLGKDTEHIFIPTLAMHIRIAWVGQNSSRDHVRCSQVNTNNNLPTKEIMICLLVRPFSKTQIRLMHIKNQSQDKYTFHI